MQAEGAVLVFRGRTETLGCAVPGGVQEPYGGTTAFISRPVGGEDSRLVFRQCPRRGHTYQVETRNDDICIPLRSDAVDAYIPLLSGGETVTDLPWISPQVGRRYDRGRTSSWLAELCDSRRSQGDEGDGRDGGRRYLYPAS
jgi:hypothetical protein